MLNTWKSAQKQEIMFISALKMQPQVFATSFYLGKSIATYYSLEKNAGIKRGNLGPNNEYGKSLNVMSLDEQKKTKKCC